MVVPGEDPAELDVLRDELAQELEPIGRQETDLVETIAMGMWRRGRIYRMEADILGYDRTEAALDAARRNRAERRQELNELYRRIDDDLDGGDQPSKVGEGEDEVDWRSLLDQATREALDTAELSCVEAKSRCATLDNEMKDLATRLDAFFLGSRHHMNGLERLHRYEAAIDRSLARARDQLRQQQRDRKERAAAHALVFDVSDDAE